MARDNGCTEYVRATAHIAVAFLPERVACRECEFLTHAGRGAFKCKLTHIGIQDLDQVSKFCPLEWEEKP